MAVLDVLESLFIFFPLFSFFLFSSHLVPLLTSINKKTANIYSRLTVYYHDINVIYESNPPFYNIGWRPCQ